jgi:hypothetical protein
MKGRNGEREESEKGKEEIGKRNKGNKEEMRGIEGINEIKRK